MSMYFLLVCVWVLWGLEACLSVAAWQCDASDTVAHWTRVEYPCNTQVSARLRLRGFSFAERTRSALSGWTEVVCLCMSVCFFFSFCMRVYMSEYSFYNTGLRLRGFSFAERTRIALLRWTEVDCLCMCVYVFVFVRKWICLNILTIMPLGRVLCDMPVPLGCAFAGSSSLYKLISHQAILFSNVFCCFGMIFADAVSVFQLKR